MKMRMAVAALDGMTHVLLLLLYHTCLGLDVTAPPSQTALFKSRVVLPCTFRVTTPPINPQFLAIIWTHGTKDLLRFDNKEKVVSDGVSFDEQAARQGSASLTIHNVTIANHGTYKCLVIYSPDRTSRDIQLNVQATPMVKIHKMGLHKNEKNQVDCSITGFFPTESLKVTWLRNDIEVLGGSKMGTFQPGADGTFRVNSSIILTPGQIQDRPSIICQVEHVSLQKPIQDGFLVTYKVAPIVQLTSLRTADGNEYLYVCKAQGFSPEPLSINWLVDGKMANLSRGREDGLYSKEIYYRIDLKEGNVPEQISCDIEHEALNNPVTKTLGVQRYNECKRNCHLGLTAVLISLLVSSLGAIAYISRKYIRKKKYLKQFQVSHIHKEHVRGNEEKVNLFCMASKCPDVVKVTWMVREHDQRPIIISESQAIKDEESGPLINHEYTVKTDQTEDNGLHNTTTVLSFNPTISSHKNTEIKCELQCGERCEERTLNFSFCYKKPSVKGPIDLSLDDSGNVVCCLTLENFYPRDVQIKWTCGVGNNQKLTSTEDIKNDSDYTSRCNSICTIPWKHFMDPGSKVRVTWTHKSLDQPGYQELSLKDFPWRPVMDNIEVPSLVHGEEAKLRCVIRGYFPDNLEVKWLRREAGKPELYEVPASDKYKIPVLEITKESDNTYTCTASIIVSVLLKTEHKSEFICRVAHPILETTLEKKTGELTVTGIPTVTRKQDDKHLIAEISHFYPKKIKVTWSRTKPKSEPENKFVPYEEKDYTVSELRHESDGTFSLTSSVKKLQDNKLYKLTVTHESMNSPIEKTYKKGTPDTFEGVAEKQEETAQGQMSNPKVAAQGGGIPTVRKQDGKHLIAEISHFYPEKITVTWSRTKQKSGLENKFVPYEEKKYTVSELRPESDGTFSLTSSVKKQDNKLPAKKMFIDNKWYKLKVAKKTNKDNKLYKLTVTHESMKSPIEKTYKEVTTDTFEEVIEKQEVTPKGEMFNSKVAAQGGEDVTEKQEETAQRQMSNFEVAAQGGDTFEDVTEKQEETAQGEMSNSEVAAQGGAITDTFEDVEKKQEETAQGEMSNSAVAAQGGEDVTGKQEVTPKGEMSNSAVAAQGGGEEMPATGVMQQRKKNFIKRSFKKN